MTMTRQAHTEKPATLTNVTELQIEVLVIKIPAAVFFFMYPGQVVVFFQIFFQEFLEFQQDESFSWEKLPDIWSLDP